MAAAPRAMKVARSQSKEGEVAGQGRKGEVLDQRFHARGILAPARQLHEAPEVAERVLQRKPGQRINTAEIIGEISAKHTL